MDISKKIGILKGIDTKSVVEKLHQYEDELEKALKDQAVFTSTNSSLIASRGNDCLEVKEAIAELTSLAPLTGENGKKLTILERDNWLMHQRKENKDLNGLITKQREAAFVLDNYQIDVEMAKKRLEGLRGVLALKTAQINFLAMG